MVFYNIPELFLPISMGNPTEGICYHRPTNSRRRRCQFQPLAALDDSFFTVSPTGGFLWPASAALDNLLAGCTTPNKMRRVDNGNSTPACSFRTDVGGLRGFRPENIDVSINPDQRTVTVTAEEKRNGNHHVIRRSLTLPRGCDASKVEATLNQRRGTLSLRAPPATAASPEKAIQAEEPKKVPMATDKGEESMIADQSNEPVQVNDANMTTEVKQDEIKKSQAESALPQATASADGLKTAAAKLNKIAEAMKHVQVKSVNNEKEINQDRPTDEDQVEATEAQTNISAKSNKKAAEAFANLSHKMAECAKHVQVNVVNENEAHQDEATKEKQAMKSQLHQTNTTESNMKAAEDVEKWSKKPCETMTHLQVNAAGEKEVNQVELSKERELEASNLQGASSSNGKPATHEPFEDHTQGSEAQEGNATQQEKKNAFRAEIDVTGFDIDGEVVAEADDAGGRVRIVCERVEVGEDGVVSKQSLTKEVPVDTALFDLSTARVEPAEGNRITVVVDAKKEEEERDATWTPVLVEIED